MGLSNDARRRRILLLSKRLDEFAAARRELLHQLVDLDAQESAAQLEHDSLHNLEAPISYVPDEVLAMIFENGVHPQDHYADHFGVLVSHVTQHWRNVSISTPKLWNSICCLATSDDDSPYPERLIGRASAFISRARPLPLNIHIEGFREQHLSSSFLQLIGDHIERCGQLRILNGDRDTVMELLEVISPQPPRLQGPDLTSFDYLVIFTQQLSPSRVPHLTTATIDDADIFTIHLCLVTFQSLTSLQLRGGLYVHIVQIYGLFQDALISLPALRHLDLSIAKFIAPSRSPILLSKIQHLHVEGFSDDVPYRYLDSLLRCIQAPNLVALSLSSWNAKEPLQVSAHPYEHHFPSLQHLILTDITTDAPHLMTFAQAFPCIERLTCEPGSHPSTFLHNINHILDNIICGDGDGAENSAHVGLVWPKLHSIAFSTSREDVDVPRLKSTILKLQAAGHPIRKLMLPQEVHPAMVEMRGIVELEDFYVDWPTPFDW